ncbi:MAG TPA: response regulator transcription factor [Puia sp.]|uniref:response regulator transcription factor n=1 Tax=Puia sp. TaxID=2045100 RepID=UPI002C4D4F90|nr:response regulator transcription factor [Puia sp.]HVU94829.1 response regulator transcription factor [Puia sp.]
MYVSDTKIAMVDDHHLFRRSVAEFINQNTRFTVNVQASNGKDFIRQFRGAELSDRPTIVIVDANMPEMDGFETAAWLQKNEPSVRVIVLTMNNSEAAIIRMIKLGAAAYLYKGIDAPELFAAIEAVENEGVYYNDYLPRDSPPPEERPASITWYSITEAERELVRRLCSEEDSIGMAKDYKMTLKSFEALKASLFAKFNVSTRIGLVKVVLKNRFVE